MATHDQELKIGSTTDGFYLVKERDEQGREGRAMYQITEEIPQYQPVLRYTQFNWQGGHGQFEFKEPDKYFEGQSIDTTQEGRLFLGPLIHEVYEDDDTELDSAPVCFLWAEKIGEWLCATSGKIYRYIQDDTGIDTDEALDAVETGIDCDADATTAIPAGSLIEIESEKMWVTATGTTLTVTRGALGTTAATHVTNTDIFIKKWTPATTAVTKVQQLVEFNGVLYAARGQTTPGTWAATDKYYTSTDGDTWTEIATLTDVYASGFLVSPNAAGTAENIWKFKTPNEVASTSNGVAAGVNWTSPTYVGDTSNNIINLFLSANRILIGKEDGLYRLDANGGVFPELPDELKINHSTDNFKHVTNWQSSSYFSLQTGMGEMTTNQTYRPMGPLTDIDDIGKIGSTVGLTSDRDYLYVAKDEGTNTHIYKCRETLTPQNRLRWEYCPWVYLGTNACNTIRVCQHSTTDRRLWFGYGTHTGYVILSDNPLADKESRFATSGWLRMSYVYGTDPNYDKLWQSAVTEALRVAAGAITTASSGETVQIKYRDDTDTSATSIISAATTVGVYETNFSAALNNKRIQFEIHLASDTSNATPVVTHFQAKGTEKPTSIRIHEAYYRVGDRPSDRAKTIRDLLRTGRTSTSLIKFADLRFGQKTSGTSSGDYVWCVMMPGYPKETQIMHEKWKQPELAIMVRLQEVSFTIS